MSVSAEEMFNEIAVSSVPEAADRVRVGASASAATETSRVPVVVAVSPPSLSVDVATTDRVKSASEFAAGVIVRPVNWAAVSVQLPSPLSVPADRTAPVGTPLMTMLNVSEPSVSVSAEEMFNEIAWSSVPEASATVRVGASATSSTSSGVSVVVAVSMPSVSVSAEEMFNEIAVSPVSETSAAPKTSKVPVVVVSLPSVAVAVATTDRVKLASEFKGGVIVSPVNWVPVSVQLPSPLSVPADRVAPVGTSPMTMLKAEKSSRSSTRAEKLSKIAASSSVKPPD